MTWRSKVKVTAGRRGGEGIHVDARASESVQLLEPSMRYGVIVADVIGKALDWLFKGRRFHPGPLCSHAATVGKSLTHVLLFSKQCIFLLAKAGEKVMTWA